MVKTLATSVVLFLSLFFATFASGQAVSPTLGRNNVWTGSNTFNGGIHVPALQQCGSTQYMAGYTTNFSPICLNFSGTTGSVATLNGLQNNVSITNPDNNLNISVVGQQIQINCPGCGGSGGTPGGSTGALQWNSGGVFVGTIINGMVKSNGTGGPAEAIGDTDFQLPIILHCSGGITCPQAGDTWTFTLSGSAGSGTVAASNFGQINGNLENNGGTTTSGAAGLYSVNGAWSLAQMNALFSRFNTTPISAWAVSGGNVVFTAGNSWSTGDTVVVVGSAESCLNNQFFTVSATGLSQTQWSAPNVGSCTGSGSDAGFQTANVPSVGFNTLALVFIPPAMVDSPANAWHNTGAQTLDWRKGYAWQQASQYGIKCDAQVLNLSITSGSNQVFVGSDFSTDPTGKTFVVAQQIGFGNSGLQEDWEPTITAFNSGTSEITLSGNAPFNYSGTTIVGTNNQYALTAAFKDLGGIFPLNIPVGCSMLSDTVHWTGTSIIGQQMNGSGFTGFPGHDNLQQQDGTPITAWSINTSTGVTTFTIPAYAAHNIIPDNGSYENVLGDQIQLENFGTSTFFNGAFVQIATQPTPTTFTVNSVFGQSTSSGTEAGLAAPTTSTNTNALRVENVSFGVHNGINPAYPWNHYSPSGTLTVEPPMYRPLALTSYPANDPLAPGWGIGAVNGVSVTTANSAVICTSTTAIPATAFVPAGQFPRIPVVGTTITFPYQGTQFSTTVASSAGSCSAGFTARTLTSALPNNAAFTGTQTEWFTTTTPQTLSVAIPSTITYPHTITLALPIAPQPGWESNVSSHGRLQINGDQFDYMGNNLTTTANTSQLVLVDGPTSINGGAGDAVGQVVFPMNPCAAMYNQPYPVTPSQSTTVATPAYAVYYPSQCGGNAAMAFPSADAIAFTPESGGLSVAYFNNVAAAPLTSNSLGNTNNNGSTFLLEEGNYTGYGNTFDAVRVNGLAFGFVQGPSAVNQHGVRVVGPTSTGQTIRDCTFRTGFPLILVNMQQSKIDRCDTYSTEVSQYDGTAVGSATVLDLSYTLSELDAQGVTGMLQFGVYDLNGEPENGNHEEILPSIVDDGTNVTYVDTIYEGGFNIFGGAFHHLIGTSMAGPVFNYGVNNYFDNLFGLIPGYNSNNLYDPTQPNLFYNWGTFGTCQTTAGQGPLRGCGPGFVQGYNGHDIWASMMGDLVHPAYNVLGGMIVPGEWTGMNKNQVFDPTELWWGSHAECNLGSSNECITSSFDGFDGFIFIGPNERLAPAKYAIKLNVKASTAMTFSVTIAAVNPDSNAYCTPNFNVQTVTLAGTTAWVPNLIPVDLSNLQGCALEVVLSNGNTTGTAEIGYFNFIPFPSLGVSIAPLATPTLHAVCPLTGVFAIDTGGIWICAPTAGVTFGSGTWKYSPAT